MSDIKYIYFDLRVKGEPARLLLAHGGVKYTDERIELGWNDPKPWTELKPSMPWGQLPMLQWKGESICQSMAICRFLAREFGIAGKTNLEMAQVDEIVDVIQDGINATYKAWYAKSKEELLKLTEGTYPTMLSQLEKCLVERGGEWMVGNAFTWADLHLFFFCSEDFLEPGVVAAYPKIANLVGRVGAMTNIKNWMESRPADGKMHPGYKIYFQNAYKCIKDME